MPIRIAIVEDHQLVRQSLARMLQMSDRLQVAGEAASGAEALLLVESVRPDIVLLDLKLPDMTGIEVAAAIREKHAAMGIIIVTMFADEEHATESMRAGANAFLSKNVSFETLLQAMEIVQAGGSFMEPYIAQHLASHLWNTRRPQHVFLTTRERTMLSLLAKGATNADIARRVYLSEKTVKQYMHQLFAKLGVKDRTEAAAEAVRRGLVL